MHNDRKEEGLKALGGKSVYKEDYSPEVLESFENQHQDKQGAHHIFGYAFQTALQLKAQYKKADENGNEQADYIDDRVRDHC